MGPLTFADLISPDPRTLPFGPYGFGGALPPETAVEFQQAAVGAVQLHESVPIQTRRSFERLQLLHIYGVLCYDLFTVTDAMSLLTLDLALAERFLAFYGGTAPFVLVSGSDRGAARPLPYDDWEGVYNALRRGGTHGGSTFGLQPRAGGRPMRMTPTFDGLLRWARAEKLLTGQRNRQLEPYHASARNRAAHPRYVNTVMPVDSARSIREIAEIINQLWGHRTPGGRRYPAPLERSVVIVGWGPAGHLTWFELPALQYAQLTETTFIAVRSAYPDDARYFSSTEETTAYPTDLIWGPGTEEELRTWAIDAPTETDTADYLDRYFLIRVAGDEVGPAIRPGVAAGLHGSAREGRWHLVRADFPVDAVGHVKRLTASASQDESKPCSTNGPCAACAAESVSSGKLDSMVRRLRELGVSVKADRPAHVAVPSPFGW